MSVIDDKYLDYIRTQQEYLQEKWSSNNADEKAIIRNR